MRSLRKWCTSCFPRVPPNKVNWRDAKLPHLNNSFAIEGHPHVAQRSQFQRQDKRHQRRSARYAPVHNHKNKKADAGNTILLQSGPPPHMQHANGRDSSGVSQVRAALHQDIGKRLRRRGRLQEATGRASLARAVLSYFEMQQVPFRNCAIESVPVREQARERTRPVAFARKRKE